MMNTAKARPAETQANLYAALRAGFPADLERCAIELADAPEGQPRFYSWRDLDEGTAMLANLLQSLELPPGSRIAVQTEKSVEALILGEENLCHSALRQKLLNQIAPSQNLTN